ncbi:MAG TPA: haloalkane dehalogenase [Polyangiaceae bacterium]|nr:haloalkane dehalogenase [Polyangiaceae bacterium]
MKVLRTPEERFASLPGFAFEPRYVELPSGEGDALRMHYVDEGPREAATVLMLHGEPSWCFLYRKVIGAVCGAGLRAVAPDLIGFGRSDKPADPGDYTYQRHVDWVWAFVEALGLRDITLLCQDWGGLIGLRMVAEHPERFARVVAANTSLPTGDRRPPDAFFAWQRFSQEAPELRVGDLVQSGCARPLPAEVVAAYDAPFPDESFKAGARRFPLLVPSAPDDPASAANRRAWASRAQFDKPVLTAFGDSDPITSGAERGLQKKIPGAAGRPHVTLARAGHFLQEDVGEELGRVVVDFVKG